MAVSQILFHYVYVLRNLLVSLVCIRRTEILFIYNSVFKKTNQNAGFHTFSRKNMSFICIIFRYQVSR